MASQSLDRYRPGCVERVPGSRELKLTRKGLAEVFGQAALGATPVQIAAHLRVSFDWFRDKIDPDHQYYDPEVHDAYHEGRSELTTKLRQQQLSLAETNAQMAIHLGKHYLDQHDRPVEHNHKHMVVGTMPDYQQTPETWRQQFAPTALQDLKEAEIEIEDAEVIDAGGDDEAR